MFIGINHSGAFAGQTFMKLNARFSFGNNLLGLKFIFCRQDLRDLWCGYTKRKKYNQFLERDSVMCSLNAHLSCYDCIAVAITLRDTELHAEHKFSMFLSLHVTFI